MRMPTTGQNTTVEEINISGTDPTNADTDSDTFGDGLEVRVETNPLDPNSVPRLILYGAAHSGPDGLSTLYKIDPLTGAATEVGPIGFERVSGMDFDPISGKLFATGERADGSDTHVLITIDRVTGIGTEVGPTGIEFLGFFGDAVADISFRNSDGALYAYLGGQRLGTIDPLTGGATVLGATFPGSCCGNGIAFSPGDTLFHATEEPLNTLDQVTGRATFIANLVFSPPADDFPRINAMDFRPGTGILFASLNDGFGGSPENYLATIDTTTGVITIIGPTVDGLDALAWVAIGPDVDGDGLSGVEEAALGTNPTNPDTDGDGLEDGVEVQNGLNPLDGTDAGADFDGDGLTNAEEIAQGTDILNNDSDNDGLSDGDEVNTFGTNPLNRDTDGGGRSDGNEVNIDGTDPLDQADDVSVILYSISPRDAILREIDPLDASTVLSVTITLSVAERLTKASAWYPWH